MGFHALEISFPLEYQPPHYRSKPGSFLAHFLGHEGPGSLYSYLKNKHWATSLSSGPQSLARGFAMFKVTIHLTEEGFSKRESFTLQRIKLTCGSRELQGSCSRDIQLPCASPFVYLRGVPPARTCVAFKPPFQVPREEEAGLLRDLGLRAPIVARPS